MSKDYLRVLRYDVAQVMTTPPLTALGPEAEMALPPLQLEDAPRPEDLTEHDRSAPDGMVSVSDGTYLQVEETRELLELEGRARGFKVTRRRIIRFHPQAPCVVIDLYQD